MQAEIVHKRSELTMRMVKFVYGSLDEVDTCKMRGAWLFFLPVLLVKTLKFIAWDFWVTLLEIDRALFTAAVGFTVGSALTALSFSLWMVDPRYMTTFWIWAGSITGVILALGGFATVGLALEDFSKSRQGRQFWSRAGQRADAAVWKVVDSPPGKILGFCYKALGQALYWSVIWPFFRVPFYHFVWQFVCGKDKQILDRLMITAVILAVVAGVTTGFTLLFLYSIIVGTAVLLGIPGAIAFVILSVLGIDSFMKSGIKDALVESVVDFKNRVCRPVKVI